MMWETFYLQIRPCTGLKELAITSIFWNGLTLMVTTEVAGVCTGPTASCHWQLLEIIFMWQSGTKVKSKSSNLIC